MLTVTFFAHPFAGLQAQSLMDIEVKVVDEKAFTPLEGATIVNDDYSISGIADENGIVSLNGIGYRDSVNISYLGYEDLRLSIKQIILANKVVRVRQSEEELDFEIVVLAKPIGRADESMEEIPYPVIAIDRKQMDVKNPSTSADALEKLAGVVVQRTQMGGGSPIIRGFEASRVLLVVDGVRLNNAIYRSGHLQNAITVDNAMLDQMEVIFGPGSLFYGSDALGGVVHFRSKDPKINYDEDVDHSQEINVSGRFSSATKEGMGHFDINYGKKNWAFLTSLSYTHFQNLKAGSNRPDEFPDYALRPFFVDRIGVDQVIENNDPNVQRFTEYSQTDFMQKVKLQTSENVYFVANYQYSTSSNVPRYDKLLDTISLADELKFAEWYYGPQRRLLASLKGRFLAPTGFYDRATIIGSYQEIDEERNERKFSELMRRVGKEDVSIWTFTGDFTKFTDKEEKSNISYGLDASFNTVESKVRNVNILEKTITRDGLTRYPNDISYMNTFGAYAIYKYRSKNDKLSMESGVRYTNTFLEAKYARDNQIEWPEQFYSGLEWNNSDVTWGLGLGYKTTDNWHFKANLAKAFRSPNIDDFARIREKNFKITVPNINLKPEKSINSELTIAKSFGKLNKEEYKGSQFKISTTVFNTDLRDAIVRRDGPLPSGETTIQDGEDTYDTQINVNADTATIRGFSANFEFNSKNKFIFKGGLNLIKGTVGFSNEYVQDTLVPFSHIPPSNGEIGVVFQNEKFSIEGQYRFHGAKKPEDFSISDIEENGYIDREGTPDNLYLTPFVYDDNGDIEYVGSLAWSTFNVYSSVNLGEKLTLNLAVENIFDKFYRPFASALPGPGRNFIISLNAKF